MLFLIFFLKLNINILITINIKYINLNFLEKMEKVAMNDFCCGHILKNLISRYYIKRNEFMSY